MSITSNNTDQVLPVQEIPDAAKPNELGGVCFSTHVRITDPNTKEVLVQIRGDN